MWRLTVGVAWDRQQARVIYDQVWADAARPGPLRDRLVRVTRHRGLDGPDGRRYIVASREAPLALRGLSIDLAAYDEVMTARDDATFAALYPALSARPEGLVLAISTAGTDRSALLRSWWERGLRIAEGTEPPGEFGMSWWAAPDDLPPDSIRGIRAANPGVADGVLHLERIAAEYGTLTPDAWRRERLNLWSTASDELFPAGAWAATAAPLRTIPPTWPVVLAVDVTPHRGHATVAVAGQGGSDGAHVAIAGVIDAERMGSRGVETGELATLVAGLAARWSPTALVWDGASAAAPMMEVLAAELDIPTTVLGPREVRAASAAFYGAIVSRELTHPGDPLLDYQLSLARRSLGDDGSWRFSRRQSSGHIDALLAAVFATYVATRPADDAAVPQVFV
jgi:phage terminase large subunit-like protein